MTDIGQLLVLHIYWNIRHHQLILWIKLDFGLCKFLRQEGFREQCARARPTGKKVPRRLSRPVSSTFTTSRAAELVPSQSKNGSFSSRARLEN